MSEHDRDGSDTVASRSPRCFGTVPLVDRPPSPRRRPPAALRALVAVLALIAALVAVALMLSDRAPGVLSTLFGDDARRLWARIDASGRADFVTEGEQPETDTIVHVAVWASVTGLVAVAVWSWRWLLTVAVAIFGASVAIEIAQGRWSSTRAVERSDIAANAVGVAIGIVAATVVYATWSAVAATLAPRGERP